MISIRTPLLQVRTSDGWAFVMSWSQASGTVITTANFKKGIRAEHQAFFERLAPGLLFRVATAEEALRAPRSRRAVPHR